MPKEYSDMNNYKVTYGDTDRYKQFGDLVGSGAFSMVYKAIDTVANETVIMKYIKGEYSARTKLEVQLLENLGGQSNTVELLDIIQGTDVNKSDILIFELVDTHGQSFHRNS